MKPHWGLVAVAGDVAGPCGGKYVRMGNEFRKAENYCMCTTDEFTDVFLICKVVFFRFCVTRKTTLNKRSQKLCVP